MLWKTESYIVVCCVCHKVKSEKAVFIPLDKLSVEDFKYFKLKNKEMKISHTYCSQCAIKLRKEMKEEMASLKKGKFEKPIKRR